MDTVVFHVNCNLYDCLIDYLIGHIYDVIHAFLLIDAL